MGIENVYRLPGMLDRTGDIYNVQRDIQETLQVIVAREGYTYIETPLLETTDLFVRKSGGELTSQVYSFVDPRGYRVTLRPEFTSSVIRHFVEEVDQTGVPMRWSYGGPVFRYGTEGSDNLREFYQIGAELIGLKGLEAEVEILTIAWNALREVGLDNFTIHLGHIGVLQDLLAQYQLSEYARLFVMNGIDDLKRGLADVETLMAKAEEFGLLNGGYGLQNSPITEPSKELVEGLLEHSVHGLLGRRSTNDIVGRLFRKMGPLDRRENLNDALTMVSMLVTQAGFPDKVLSNAKDILKSLGQNTAPLKRFQALCDALAKTGIDSDRIVVDLGLARGISYYTGMIFELIHPMLPIDSSLGGGGRYDDLVKALGGQKTPALGFAYNIDILLKALAAEQAATK